MLVSKIVIWPLCRALMFLLTFITILVPVGIFVVRIACPSPKLIVSFLLLPDLMRLLPVAWPLRPLPSQFRLRLLSVPVQFRLRLSFPAHLVLLQLLRLPVQLSVPVRPVLFRLQFLRLFCLRRLFRLSPVLRFVPVLQFVLARRLAFLFQSLQCVPARLMLVPFRRLFRPSPRLFLVPLRRLFRSSPKFLSFVFGPFGPKFLSSCRLFWLLFFCPLCFLSCFDCLSRILFL